MTIAEFLLRLATDEDLLEEFNRDREGMLLDEALSDEDRRLLLAGNTDELRVKVTAEFHVRGQKVAYHTVYTVPGTVYVPPPPPPPETTQS
jgi:hypothetical protein